MAKKTNYSLDQFKVDRYQGVLYNHPKEEWIGASRAQTDWYNKQKGITATKTKAPKSISIRGQRVNIAKSQYGKYFSSGTKFTTRQGHAVGWSKPLSLKGGNTPNYNWGRANFTDSSGKVRLTSSNNQWGANINKSKSGVGGAVILEGSKQWIQQLQISIYALNLQAENFRVMVGRRAIKVFQNSFKYQQFYHNKSQKWPALSEATLKKRAKRGTGSRILKEYGDLYNSIKLEENAGPFKTRVYTDIVPANTGHHKRQSICYAGYHNEGHGTYGAPKNGHTPKAYIKRKFMGHSSYLNPFTDSFIRKMMKLYLFDSVFLVKKG